jgi:hypothetical protein
MAGKPAVAAMDGERLRVVADRIRAEEIDEFSFEGNSPSY